MKLAKELFVTTLFRLRQEPTPTLVVKSKPSHKQKKKEKKNELVSAFVFYVKKVNKRIVGLIIGHIYTVILYPLLQSLAMKTPAFLGKQKGKI